MLDLHPATIVVLSGLLFFIGLVGFVVRRNLIVMLIALELMFNAVNLNMVGFSYLLSDWNGQMFTIFIISIAASEAAIGLGIIIALYRHSANVDVDEVSLLRW
jgi:NADH-quinone oxidoreductase subunit K